MINRLDRDWLECTRSAVEDTERYTLQLIENNKFSTDSKQYRTIYDINQKSHDILFAIRTYYP